MRRTLILTTEKTGSTLLIALLLGKAGKWETWNILPPVWLRTVPEHQCRLWHGGTPQIDVLKDKALAPPNGDSDEAYCWTPPANLDKSFYDNLGDGDWKFIYLFRDPRGRIESLTRRACGSMAPVDPGVNFVDPGYRSTDEKWRTIFKGQCDIAGYWVQSVLQMVNDPRFMLLRFFDLTSDTLNTAVRVFSFMGYEIDRDFYKALIDEQDAYRGSSCRDNGAGAFRRWEHWTKEEREYFNKVAGAGLVDLGYERDSSWVVS